MDYPLVSSMSEFSEFMCPLGHFLISQCSDGSGFELYLIGDVEGVSRVLAKVGTCRGEVRVFKTLESVRAWLTRNRVSPYVGIRCDLSLSVPCDLTLFEAFRCKGCGRFRQAAYVGAPVCHSCASSLSLECDARAE